MGMMIHLEIVKPIYRFKQSYLRLKSTIFYIKKTAILRGITLLILVLSNFLWIDSFIKSLILLEKIVNCLLEKFF